MYNFDSENKPNPNFSVEYIPDPDTGMVRFFKSWLDQVNLPPEPEPMLTLGEYITNISEIVGNSEEFIQTMREKYGDAWDKHVTITSVSPFGEELEKDDIIETSVTFTINDWVAKDD